MPLTGQQIIAMQDVCSGEGRFHAVDPRTGETLAPAFSEGTVADVDRAAQAAEQAFDAFRAIPRERRADFLDAIGDELLALGDELLQRASAETGLPRARLEGERLRTVNQLRLFARLVREGSWRKIRIDHGDPQRQPLPKPDLRLWHLPVGPVTVFGASNFPLAFSVAGGDTASALAAGCPVLVKGHPAHPGTSELAARAIVAAMNRCVLPAGTFSLLQGSGPDVGAALVRHPLIRAAAFTGSLAGGRALYDLAAARPEPIPVFAEMGSINPVFLLPGALAERAETIAVGLVEAMTLGVGQFCTKPGVVVAITGDGWDAFVRRVEVELEARPGGIMLHAGIRRSFQQGVDRLAAVPGVVQQGNPGAAGQGGCEASPLLFKADSRSFLDQPVLQEELFGPASLLIACDDADEMLAVARHLKGQLTATIHGSAADVAQLSPLLRIVERKVGRLIFNGFPTGVEVGHAMNHGGPYPATTDCRFTSVGSAAIERFLRPLCYQNFPIDLLPASLRDADAGGGWRLSDGELSR